MKFFLMHISSYKHVRKSNHPAQIEIFASLKI